MPLPSMPQLNLAKAAAAGALGSPSTVSILAEVAVGGAAKVGHAAGLMGPLTTAATVGSTAAAGAAAASMAAIAIPAAGSTLLVGDAITAADEGRLQQHLVNEGMDFATHVFFASVMGGLTILAVPTTPFTVCTVLIAAATSKATSAVSSRLLQCTSAANCAFKISNPDSSLSGGSYSKKSTSRKSTSRKSASTIRFLTISIINEKSIEIKRITLESKQNITMEVYKKEVEKIMNVFVEKMTPNELKF